MPKIDLYSTSTYFKYGQESPLCTITYDIKHISLWQKEKKAWDSSQLELNKCDILQVRQVYQQTDKYNSDILF